MFLQIVTKPQTHFDGIAERRACAVRFQGRGLVHVAAGPHRLNQSLLRRAVRRCEARARPVLLHRRPSHRRVVRLGREEEGPAPLAATVSVGASVERVASAQTREHTRRGEGHRYDDGQHSHPGGFCFRTLA